MEEEEEDLRSASYNPPNNAPYTTCEIRSGHAHDPAAAATSQQTGTISRTPTPAGSRREFSRPNCQLPCADRNSRDGVPWPVDEGVWLTAEDWGPVFHRFRTLQTLSVCTCCRLGYMARPLVKLALPRTEEVKAEALNGDSDLRGCGRFGCPCRQRLLYHLEELVVTQITSESFHICSGCYLPGLRRLRLGFIEISIGHHNIRAFLQRTALPVSSPLHAREERCVWHPLEELCLHCDEDDDEQLRLALLLNRIVGQIASYQRSERSSDSLGAGVHNSGRRVSTPLWPNPQPPEATGQDAENGVRSHDEDRWQSFYPVTRSVRLPMQQYDAQHGSSNDSAFMTAASDDDEPWSTLRITERHGHGHHSPASTVGGICLPYLAILQVPRIGLLSPALPSAAPQLAHLRSFESWEFFSATQAWPLQPQIEASSDATVPLCSVFDCEADMPKEDPQRYATFVEAIQKGVIPVPSGEISDIGLRDTRRGSSLEEQNSDASDASVNLHSCCTHGNDTYGSLQNSLSTWGPDQGTPTLRCRFVFKRRLPSATRLSVPKGTKPPLLQYASRFAWSFLSIIKTPSVLRLQELLAELPYMRSIAFYHSLDIYQLAGLQWALQPYARRWCPSHQQCHQRGFASPDSPARRSTCTSNVRAVVFVHPEGCGHLAECRAEANRRLWTSVPNDCQTHGPQDASEHLPTLQLRLWRGVEPWMLVSSCTPLSRPLNNTSSPSKIATRHEAGCTPPGAQAIATASDVTVNRDQPSAQLPPRGALLLTAGVQLDRFFSPST